MDLHDVTEDISNQLGPFKKIIEINRDNNSYYYYTEFAKSTLDIQITFDNTDKIIGFFFIPHKDFSQHDISASSFQKILSNDIELQGTFLEPTENNLKKMVIFIHGSGPNDRDETLGPNKPFKDIAEYLYKNGISSYRYDKRTFSNPETFNDQSTVEHETINDVLNVIKFYSNYRNDHEIILFGHSLGGYLIPKIMQAKPKVAKLIFLAANSRPLDEIIVEQLEYINKTDSIQIPSQFVQQTKEKVAFLRSNKFNIQTPSSKLPFDLSATYWHYLLNYNPLQYVTKLNQPMFFAQGGKDYQVTEEDFNLWKNKLKNKSSVKFKYYPLLNHIFIKGNDIPSPKDYDVKNNVGEDLLRDLSDFIMKE